MKHILPLLCLMLASSAFAIEPPTVDPKPSGATIDYQRFKEGCLIAKLVVKSDRPVTLDTVDVAKANESMGYIKGYFACAQQIQEANPDVRIMDPLWKGCDFPDYLARVNEILAGLDNADPLKEHLVTTREVLALAIRSKDGVPDLKAPR
jgi:hypothetical protein